MTSSPYRIPARHTQRASVRKDIELDVEWAVLVVAIFAVLMGVVVRRTIGAFEALSALAALAMAREIFFVWRDRLRREACRARSKARSKRKRKWISYT